jgi:hypothetical protein
MWFYCETTRGEEVTTLPFEFDTKTLIPGEALDLVHTLLVVYDMTEVILKNETPYVKRFVKTHEGIFPHKCAEYDCDVVVQFDDEPRCFTHSPDEGSSVLNYSYRKGLM